MSEKVWLGMDEKLRKYANDKNLQETAEQAKKQTEILEKAEQQKIKAMYDIARQEKYEREQERIMEQEEYQYRRNREIFDKIGFDYSIVNDIYNMLNYTEKKIYILNELQNKDIFEVEFESEENKNFLRNDDNYNKEEIFKQEFEKKYRGNEIIETKKINEKQNSCIYDKVVLNRKRIKQLQWILGIVLGLFVLDINVLAIGLLSVYILIMFGLIFNWIILNKSYNDISDKFFESDKLYDELYEKYRNEKIEQLKKKYNKLLDEFKEFRRTNYNKEVETALDLIGIIDNDLLEESIGTTVAYKKYFNEFSSKLREIEEEVREIPCY